jgi:hypothetical protein
MNVLGVLLQMHGTAPLSSLPSSKQAKGQPAATQQNTDKTSPYRKEPKATQTKQDETNNIDEINNQTYTT